MDITFIMFQTSISLISIALQCTHGFSVTALPQQLDSYQILNIMQDSSATQSLINNLFFCIFKQNATTK